MAPVAADSRTIEARARPSERIRILRDGPRRNCARTLSQIPECVQIFRWSISETLSSPFGDEAMKVPRGIDRQHASRRIRAVPSVRAQTGACRALGLLPQIVDGGIDDREPRSFDHGVARAENARSPRVVAL